MAEGRRRGDDLLIAIFHATFAELAENGFEALTFERVARRAKAGKASLYQRWKTPADLVTAALEYAEQQPDARPRSLDLGNLRDELIAFLDDLARGLKTPVGQALLPLIAQANRHPGLYEKVVSIMIRPRQALVRQALQRASERGEMPPAVITERLVSAGPQLLVVTHLTAGGATHADVVSIVDDVVLPAALDRPRVS